MLTNIRTQILKNFSLFVETETETELVFVCDGAFLYVQDTESGYVATIEAEGCDSVEVTEDDCITKIREMVTAFVAANDEEFAEFILEAFAEKEGV